MFDPFSDRCCALTTSSGVKKNAVFGSNFRRRGCAISLLFQLVLYVDILVREVGGNGPSRHRTATRLVWTFDALGLFDLHRGHFF